MRMWGTLCPAVVIILAAGMPARAQTPDTYPNQMVRIVVPFSAGSITDGLARVIADKLQDTWKQQVVIENRPGLPGTAGVAKSTPDGYTLLLTSNGHTIAGVINKNIGFDPVKDFAGITLVASIPLAVIVPPELPAKTVKEFIALAKQKPGQLNFASAGIASTAYLATELFKQTAKIDMVHVPYKGTPEATTSIIRNDSQLFFIPMSLSIDLQQTGKVRAIAVTTAQRSKVLPDVPTLAEAGLPDYKYDAWFGIMAPAGTPRPIIDKINADIVHVLQIPEVKESLVKQGVDVVVDTPVQFDALIKDDTARYSKILRDAGVGAN